MKIKILNLNIWNYSQWDKRETNIIRFIQKHNPDIIILQEVRDDIKFNKKGDNQAKQLNRVLGYGYYNFTQISDKRKERPTKYKRYCMEGQALLSKFPIISSKKILLRKADGDRYNCANVLLKLKVSSKIVDLLSVHFSNSDITSLLHLIETMKYLRKYKLSPIMAGDFNMYHNDWLEMLIDEEFKSSYSYKKYISFPIRKWTLDYIVIPNKYNFKSLVCEGDGVSVNSKGDVLVNDRAISDHRGLVVEVEI